MTQYLTPSESNFEDSQLGAWTAWVDAPVIDVNVAHTGTRSMSWSHGAGTGGITLPTRTIVAGARTLSFSFWGRASVATPVTCYLRFIKSDGSQSDIAPGLNWSPVWSYHEFGGAIPPGTVGFQLYFVSGVAGTFNADDIQVVDDLAQVQPGFLKRGRKMRFLNNDQRGAGSIYFNDGLIDDLGCRWWANKLSGWDDADGEATAVAKAYDDGAHIEDGYYGAQLITLDGTIECRDVNAIRAGKRRLIKLTDALRYDCQLYVEDLGDQELMRNVRKSGLSITTGSVLVKFQLRMVSGDHARQSAVDRTLTVPAAGASGLAFDPNVEFAPNVSMPSGGNSSTAVVNGDTYTWPIVEIQGPVTDPVVHNDTEDAFVGVNFALPLGSTMTFDMAQKDVRVNGISIYSTIMPGSTFWRLVPGFNLLSYGGAGSAALTVTWKDAWV